MNSLGYMPDDQGSIPDVSILNGRKSSSFTHYKADNSNLYFILSEHLNTLEQAVKA